MKGLHIDVPQPELDIYLRKLRAKKGISTVAPDSVSGVRIIGVIRVFRIFRNSSDSDDKCIAHHHHLVYTSIGECGNGGTCSSVFVVECQRHTVGSPHDIMLLCLHHVYAEQDIAVGKRNAEQLRRRNITHVAVARHQVHHIVEFPVGR